MGRPHGLIPGSWDWDGKRNDWNDWNPECVCVEGGGDGHSNKKKMFKLSLILFILEPLRAQSWAPKTLRPIPAVFQDEGTSVVGEYRAVYSTTQLCFLTVCLLSWHRVFLCSSGWLGTPCVGQASLKFVAKLMVLHSEFCDYRHISPCPVPISLILGLVSQELLILELVYLLVVWAWIPLLRVMVE